MLMSLPIFFCPLFLYSKIFMVFFLVEGGGTPLAPPLLAYFRLILQERAHRQTVKKSQVYRPYTCWPVSILKIVIFAHRTQKKPN